MKKHLLGWVLVVMGILGGLVVAPQDAVAQSIIRQKVGTNGTNDWYTRAIYTRQAVTVTGSRDSVVFTTAAIPLVGTLHGLSHNDTLIGATEFDATPAFDSSNSDGDFKIARYAYSALHQGFAYGISISDSANVMIEYQIVNSEGNPDAKDGSWTLMYKEATQVQGESYQGIQYVGKQYTYIRFRITLEEDAYQWVSGTKFSFYLIGY